MNHEVWICGYPGTCGGALTEMLHCIDLLRQHDVDVHLVPVDAISDIARAWDDSIGCHTHAFEGTAMFADKILLGFNNGRLISKMPDIVRDGRPKAFVWWNTMTTQHRHELMCHMAGWIDYHAFGSEYQRSMLLPQLRSVNPEKTVEFEGYEQYLNPDNDLQRLSFEYTPPTKSFTIGRISRDDPRKFAPDTWQILDSINTGSLRKRALILGFGGFTQRIHGDPPKTLECRCVEADHLPVNVFYRSVHCIIHKTGGSGESYCRIVPEAYAAGVPMIVEHKFAFPEIIIDGETGFMCEDGDEMIERAEQLARDEGLRKKIIFQAREYLMTHMADGDRIWKSWDSLLTRISER